MSKVYVTQEKARKINGEWVSEFDMTPALKYGEVVILMPPGSSFFSPVPTIRALREKLDGFTEEDYILPVGDPAIMVAAAMIAGNKNTGRIKLLKWDRYEGQYVPLQIDTTGRAV